MPPSLFFWLTMKGNIGGLLRRWWMGERRLGTESGQRHVIIDFYKVFSAQAISRWASLCKSSQCLGVDDMETWR